MRWYTGNQYIKSKVLMEIPRDTHGFVDLLIHFIGMKKWLIQQLIEPPFPVSSSSFSDSWVCVFPICDEGFLHNTPVTKARDKKRWHEVQFILMGFQPVLVGSRLFVSYYVIALVVPSLVCPTAKIIVVAAFFFHFLVFPLLSVHWQDGLHYLDR